MRKNLPVTNVEYPITDDTLIVSKTDAKGKLTFFNQDFVDAAGFTEAELMGQPHNIVRHPDMPPEAFDNLWTTLKAGRPWVGAVKNRRKNGDYYWVLATASPIRKDGQVVGYTSVRTKLPSDQRAEAEQVYAAIRDKKPHGYKIDDGIVRRRSVFDHLAMFTGTIASRLRTLLGLQTLFLIVLGVMSFGGGGLAGMTGAGIAAAGVLLCGLVGLRTMHVIVGPLDHVNETMESITQGKLDTRMRIERDDEIGRALRNLQTVQTMVRFNARELMEQEKRAAISRKQEMSRLADSFESAVGNIVETVSSASSELESSANSLSGTATRGQELSTTVAAASEEASANVQAVASATEELTSSVREISRQVQESARIASDAVEQARRTNDRVGELSKAATRIGDVVELINTIAGQTNLLALNATIEAARAGEAGRGFAVVASEVKALAEQTAKATGEIGQQIGSIQSATQESVTAIREISVTIERLSEISATVAAAVEEQGAATSEISRNIQHAATGTQQVSSNITDVQRGASETGDTSGQVLTAARQLSGDSQKLKQEVSRFLQSVRAA
ncbi:PAS domain-containing protein [Bradyrhizobium sp. 83012]|uniref:PAS domain-containing protein n=1 Tax=Bradyrhizobium aeschynomenes TaxID=2734909 RepID=A0ABX2CHY8_9BRAD|nr:methyl-accepting chemotaxis protein [Bradyrhizobium aeschynomenes]NPU10653.1 PAS domain-containing protein [Bradyrhizobium aeschynomenes]NPU66922.1 PAS domain-containing protein [Bradyrhizobium aeschynomenes]NPV24900.1 PAS domain-containing protein [Bradyrhizobium aeschynomenes]